MNPNAIYSKSGKGVQEAAGKTSLLSRPDRAVLSAIDGRATLADVAQKVGKTFDPAFEKLIETLDKSGFIRAVSAGASGAKPAAGKPAPTAPIDAASDLDFTAAMSAPKGRPPPPPQAPPRATPPPKKPSVTIPPPPPPPTADEKAKAERIAKEQQEAFIKAREEAELKAAGERERIKAEAEAKLRAETESKLRAEGETKAKADAEKKLAAEAEAKVKAAAEAKAKAEAEAKKAREEAERVRKEAEEKARREQEELKRKLEEERKAREEAERKAKEDARRLEEERRKLEEERKRVEAERKRAEEERKREEAERAARKKREEAEEQAAAAAAAAAESAKAKETQAPQAPGSFSDSLLADLDSFTNKEENEVKEKAEAERKVKEEAERRAREEAERRAKEEAERQEREEKERDKQRQKEDAAARKQAEERELREREEREKQRLAEEEEKRKKEAEEREKKAKQEERMSAAATKAPGRGGEPFSEEEALRRRRERQLGPSKTSAAAAKERIARGGWGKPIAITLFLLLVVGLGVAHIMPLDVSEYRAAAEEALGRPVKIGGARLSMLTGMPELKFSDVVVGETRIAEVRAFPELDALSGPTKRFSRIEIAGAKLDQEVLGQALFAKAKGDNFSVARITARNIEFVGPLTLPKGLEFEAVYDAEGMVRAATVRGPEALVAKLLRKEGAVEVEMSAASFSVPFAPEISLTKFGLKGTATPRGLSVSEWDGQLLNGTLSGTANVRWGDTWLVDGVLTARNITAAVFAPALLSDGRGEGSGKFSMRGDPGKLAANARLDGSFTITRGILGTIDLSRAIQTAGKQATGRTQFNEMNGHAVYDRGAVALRNVTISAGQLNAGASADIAQSGALSGRIVADVKVSSQTLRATLNLGGTVKEPQVRN
jgi:hypothetical protein